MTCEPERAVAVARRPMRGLAAGKVGLAISGQLDIESRLAVGAGWKVAGELELDCYSSAECKRARHRSGLGKASFSVISSFS